MSVPAYIGDFEFMKLLKAVGSEKEMPELRATIMKTIWSVDYTPPSDLLEIVLSKSVADKKTTEKCVGQFLALYNRLSNHQDIDNPFKFFEFPKIESYSMLMKKLGHRQHELKELTPLFHDAGAFSSKDLKAEAFALLDDFDVGLAELRTVHEILTGKFDDISYLPIGDQELTRIEKKFELIFNELGQIHKQEREIQMVVRDILGESLEESDGLPYEKIGRNEPCRCGSGRKFKKCCLQ